MCNRKACKTSQSSGTGFCHHPTPPLHQTGTFACSLIFSPFLYLVKAQQGIWRLSQALPGSKHHAAINYQEPCWLAQEKPERRNNIPRGHQGWQERDVGHSFYVVTSQATRMDVFYLLPDRGDGQTKTFPSMYPIITLSKSP